MQAVCVSCGKVQAVMSERDSLVKGGTNGAQQQNILARSKLRRTLEFGEKGVNFATFQRRCDAESAARSSSYRHY
jgi:hypothetical protein